MRVALAFVAACSASPAIAPKPTIVIEESHDYFFQPIHFTSGSSTILDESRPLLASQSKWIRDDRKSFVLVELSGYADPSEADPVALSEKRARNVRDAVIALGVDASLVRAKGYAAFCAEPGRTDWNAAVRFSVVRTSYGPTGIDPGCDAARSAGIVTDP